MKFERHCRQTFNALPALHTNPVKFYKQAFVCPTWATMSYASKHSKSGTLTRFDKMRPKAKSVRTQRLGRDRRDSYIFDPTMHPGKPSFSIHSRRQIIVFW